jgi:hypothetical protein
MDVVRRQTAQYERLGAASKHPLDGGHSSVG